MIARENGFRKWTGLKAHIDRIAIEQHAIVEGRPSVLDCGERTLHIRWGTDIMYDLALGGFSGDFLSFADPYVEGPVPQTQSLEEFVRIRADYLSSKIARLSFVRISTWNAHAIMQWSTSGWSMISMTN